MASKTHKKVSCPPKNFKKQECIPVGCVPAAQRPYPGRGNLETPPQNLETPRKIGDPPRKFGDPPGPDHHHVPPPPGQTDACELITLAQLRCGR